MVLIVPVFVQKAEPRDLYYPPETLYEFAAENFNNGDYLAAAIEFKRFGHFFPDHPKAAAAGFKAGIAYYRIPRYSAAINAFRHVAKKYSKSDYAVESGFMISKCHVKLNDLGQAILILNEISMQAENQNVRDRALYKIGKLRIKTGDISGTKAALNRISPENKDFQINRILKEIDDPDIISTKNPLLAGLFSIIPGGGYLYCGRYREAATAFFLTAGLAAASWEAFDEDLQVIGCFAGLAGIGFYGGGMIGSVTSAYKYNRKSFSDYVDQLPEKSRLSPLSLGIRPDSVAVLFSWRF